MSQAFITERLDDSEQAFRPAKRRKQYRRRHDEDGDPIFSGPELSVPQPPVASNPDNFDPVLTDALDRPASPVASDGKSLAELLQWRKLPQRRRGGIEFTNKGGPREDRVALVESGGRPTEQDEVANEVEKVVNRFAPQTGQVADVDKHMMAYIDSELAKRRYGPDSAQYSDGKTRETSPGGTTIQFGRNRQAAGLGKLHEVDLGEDARLRNISLTEAAKRRLESGEPLEEVIGKVRLGRDGKPRRARKRRGSEDVKRDKLVEEVLKESKLEIYDEPDDAGGEGEEAADERLAEQFRRDFLDAMSSRRRRRKATTAKKTGPGAKEEEKTRGPKLGGSRSARAAMRELEKAKEAKR